FFLQAEDGIRDRNVTGVQTCALPIYKVRGHNMKCMECNKEPATLHFTKFIDGNKEEIHLCQSCANKREEAIVDESYTLHDLLTGLFNFEAGQVDMNMQAFQKKEEKDLIC